MKILFASDGSPFSQAVLKEIERRAWPHNTTVRIICAVHSRFPLVADPIFVSTAAHLTDIREETARLNKALEKTVADLQAARSDLNVEGEVLIGAPKEVILDEAENWSADLIMLGSHGYGSAKRILLGSVAHAVALHAKCSVEIVRDREAIAKNE